MKQSYWSVVVLLAIIPIGIEAQTLSSGVRAFVPGAPVGVTAFVDVNVVPMDTERVLPGQTVLVQGGRITVLGPASQVRVPQGAVQIDGRGQYLLPGFHDMHTHLASASRAMIKAPLGLAEWITAEQKKKLSGTAELWLLQWLATGVTTIRDMGSAEELILPLRARVAAGELWSPRIYAAGLITADTGIAKQVAALKAAGFDLIKMYSPPAEVFDSIISVTRRLTIPVAGHLGGAKAKMIEQVLPMGLRSIEHLEGYLVWDYENMYKTIESGAAVTIDVVYPSRATDTLPTRVHSLATATQRAGVWNTPTLAIILRSRSVRSEADSAAMRALFRPFIKGLQAAGAGLLLGTDAHSSANMMHLEFQELVRAGLTPYQALVAATRSAAAYFGRLEETGTVAVGKQADLVLLPGNPLEDIGYTAQPNGTMVSGRWLARAALGQHVAALVSVLEQQDRLRKQYYTYLKEFRESSKSLRAGPELTGIQREALTDIVLRHDRHQAALLDSLVREGSEPDRAGRQRLLTMFVRLLEAYRREVLSAAQQAIFDPGARTWIQRYTEQGYRVAIAGVRP